MPMLAVRDAQRHSAMSMHCVTAWLSCCSLRLPSARRLGTWA